MDVMIEEILRFSELFLGIVGGYEVGFGRHSVGSLPNQ